MTKLEKNVIKIVITIKYFSILCAGGAIALILENGFNVENILLITLATIVFYCTNTKIKEDLEDIIIMQ